MLDSAKAGDVLLMLRIAIRKHVTTVSVGYKIQLFGARRIGCSFERCAPGIGNRPGRQSIDDIGVVRGRLLYLTFHDGAPQRSLPASQTVDNRRIRLQAHLRLEAVDENGRDART